MAAPIVALIPAILTAIWAGLVTVVKWCIDHYHIVKIVIVCSLITAAFWLGVKVYSALMSTLQEYFSEIAAASPSGTSGTVDILAKANYVLPVSEMLALLVVYVTFASLCLSVKFILMGYKAIPFKNA